MSRKKTLDGCVMDCTSHLKGGWSAVVHFDSEIAVGKYLVPAERVEALQARLEEENVAADAYGYACDEMVRWQHKRRKAGKDAGTTGSLCDGIQWLYARIAELEADKVKLRQAIQKQLDPKWECNSDHPALLAALSSTEER